jgi:tRNA pseudouridine13 synthase
MSAVHTVHGKRNWKAPRQAKVKVLTEQDIAEGKHTIFDVVMPLPGFDVDYPEGRVAEIIDEVMKADGLDPTKMRRDQR